VNNFSVAIVESRFIFVLCCTLVMNKFRLWRGGFVTWLVICFTAPATLNGDVVTKVQFEALQHAMKQLEVCCHFSFSQLFYSPHCNISLSNVNMPVNALCVDMLVCSCFNASLFLFHLTHSILSVPIMMQCVILFYVAVQWWCWTGRSRCFLCWNI